MIPNYTLNLTVIDTNDTAVGVIAASTAAALQYHCTGALGEYTSAQSELAQYVLQIYKVSPAQYL